MLTAFTQIAALLLPYKKRLRVCLVAVFWEFGYSTRKPDFWPRWLIELWQRNQSVLNNIGNLHHSRAVVEVTDVWHVSWDAPEMYLQLYYLFEEMYIRSYQSEGSGPGIIGDWYKGLPGWEWRPRLLLLPRPLAIIFKTWRKRYVDRPRIFHETSMRTVSTRGFTESSWWCW